MKLNGIMYFDFKPWCNKFNNNETHITAWKLQKKIKRTLLCVLQPLDELRQRYLIPQCRKQKVALVHELLGTIL